MTLIDAVRATIRRLHYSPRTEEAYVHWIRQFSHFHSGKHPRQMGAEEVTVFLNEFVVAFLGHLVPPFRLIGENLPLLVGR
jgi:hypothetical protein